MLIVAWVKLSFSSERKDFDLSAIIQFLAVSLQTRELLKECDDLAYFFPCLYVNHFCAFKKWKYTFLNFEFFRHFWISTNLSFLLNKFLNAVVKMQYLPVNNLQCARSILVLDELKTLLLFLFPVVSQIVKLSFQIVPILCLRHFIEATVWLYTTPCLIGFARFS